MHRRSFLTTVPEERIMRIAMGSRAVRSRLWVTNTFTPSTATPCLTSGVAISAPMWVLFDFGNGRVPTGDLDSVADFAAKDATSER